MFLCCSFLALQFCCGAISFALQLFLRFCAMQILQCSFVLFALQCSVLQLCLRCFFLCCIYCAAILFALHFVCAAAGFLFGVAVFSALQFFSVAVLCIAVIFAL